MKKIEAELTAYITYECPNCKKVDNRLFEIFDITNIDPDNVDIKVECPFCEEIFFIDKITD